MIAGEFAGSTGPAQTFTPMQVWDLRFTNDQTTEFELADGDTTLLVVLKGELRVNGSQMLKEAEVGLFDSAGGHIRIDQAEGAIALLLSGEPINEPIVGQGPFVMNSYQEIREAIADYQSGKMGQLS